MPVQSPALRGYLTGLQQNAQEQGQGLQQMQGILGLQGALMQQRFAQQSQPLQLELMKAQVENARNPAPILKDLGGSIGLFHPRTYEQIGELPKTVTPDALLREGGAASRHAEPSGSSLLSERGAAARHAQPSGSARLQAGVNVRGQDLVDIRAREANEIAGRKRVEDQTSSLRKEFNDLSEVKNYKSVIPMLRSVQNAPDTPSGDLDLIYAVGKTLDPGSVVREGELALVIKAGSPVQRFEGAVRNITSGRGRLAPSQRAELINMLRGRVNELKFAHDSALNLYKRDALKRGLPTNQIFMELPEMGVVRGKPPDDILEQADAILRGSQ